MSNVEEQLNYAEKKLEAARQGDQEAMIFLRDIVRTAVDRSPDKDMLLISDFILDFLREHVKAYLRNN